jgi:predicted amidohydrolase
MKDTFAKIKAAAVQAAPVLLDREATIAKACRLIEEAGEAGAKVIGFPESYIPAHP